MDKNKFSKYYPTPLIKTDIMVSSGTLNNVYIKDESRNPFGTIKDRRNYYVIQEAES